MAINNFFSRFISDFRRVSSRFLKCSFHFWCLSSWLAAFSFALKVLFLVLTSFTVCHTNCNCSFSTKFLILLIWPWIKSYCSFLYVLVSSLWTFLSFCTLAFVRFPLLSKAAFLMLSCFSFTAIDFQVTLHLALSLVGMHSAAASTYIYLSFRECLLDVSWKASNLFLTVTVNWLHIDYLQLP